jgi:DNA-binding NtrC family response regulator
MLLEGCRISVVEDDPIMGESLVQSLTLEGCQVNWWRSGAEAVHGVGTTEPDLVVCDIRLPDADGETVFRRLASKGTVPPFLFVTGFANIDQAVALMRAGAADYITKPFEMAGFIARVEALVLRRSHGEPATTTLGVSEPMQRVEAMLRRVAGRIAPVLITGETGVGKEVCARYLHRAGGRRGLIPVQRHNTRAMPSGPVTARCFSTRSENCPWRCRPSCCG